MFNPPWDVIITAGLSDQSAQPDEISRTYTLAANGSENEIIPPDSTEEVYLLWGIVFGDDTDADTFKLSLSNNYFSINNRLLGNGTILSGIPMFAEWTKGNPINVSIANKTGAGSVTLTVSFKFIRFPTRESWASFRNYLETRYDHRPFLKAAKAAGGG